MVSSNPAPAWRTLAANCIDSDRARYRPLLARGVQSYNLVAVRVHATLSARDPSRMATDHQFRFSSAWPSTAVTVFPFNRLVVELQHRLFGHGCRVGR